MGKKVDETLETILAKDKEPADVAVLEEEAPPQGKKKFIIIIDEQQNMDKNQPVFTTDGQNTQYSIKRGHHVCVPQGVVSVLGESVYKEVNKNEQTGEETFRFIKRYAMRVVKEVTGWTKEEIEAEIARLER